jgi:hypothetical protein
MYAGSPARKFAQLDDAKPALTALIVQQYCQYAQDFSALENVTAPVRSVGSGSVVSRRATCSDIAASCDAGN